MDDKVEQRQIPRPMSVYMGAVMAMVTPGMAQEAIDAHAQAVKRMIAGIQKYQAAAYRRTLDFPPALWSEGSSKVYHYPAAAKKRTALLVVPSMINGPEILDLHPGRSFVRWMAGQGVDVYLLDWGTPKDDAGLQDINGVITRLQQAAKHVAAIEGQAIHALGYCMGGTLLYGAAAGQPDIFGKLMTLSAPWDFHAGDPTMRAQVMTGAASALQLLETKNFLPVDWIQTVFAHVNPRLALDKFASFLDMTGDDADLFIAVEDWLNSGQDLSAGVARACILDWYGHNAPATGAWVDLNALKSHPLFLVAAARDILVPPDSAVAAAQYFDEATVIRPDCGHISLMAGRRAMDNVWVPACDWLVGTA
jgi:polyhydroxyalkanoate synthase